MTKPAKEEKKMRVKLVNSPSGAGCRHVHVTDLGGEIIDSFMRDDFGQDDDGSEPRIRRRIKFLVKRFLVQNPNASVAQIKSFIEGEEV